MLPENELNCAIQLAKEFNVFISIGTSAKVYPAAKLPKIPKENGAYLGEININKEMQDSDICIKGKAELILPQIVKEIIEISD